METTDGKHRVNETECGLGCHPSALQKCAKLPCFVACYGMCVFVSQSLNVYISSQITSIEKQFGFSGTQTGFLLSCGDISFLACVLLTSHFFGKGRIPKYIALVTFVFGISGLVCALPHLVLGVKDEGLRKSDTTSYKINELCQRGSNMSNVNPEECAGVGGDSYTYTAFAILVIGMMFQGFAKSPRSALVTAYIDSNVNDENRSGLYMGITLAIATLGPAVAILLGGVFSGMYVTLEEVSIDETDPRWIGAWWVGFILFGGIALVVAIPVCFFPKYLPIERHLRHRDHQEDQSKRSDAYKVESTANSVSGGGERKNDVVRNFKEVILEFLKVMKILVTNVVFMLVVIGTAFKMLSFSAFVFLGPKYVERQFLEPSWKVNYIYGGISIVSVFGGSLCGGVLTTKLKLTRMGVLKLILVTSVISCIGLSIGMVLGCDQPIINNFDRIRNADSTTVSVQRSTDDTCATGCICNPEQYVPVCADKENFYSACYAGCSNRTDEVFTDCSCVGLNDTATSGFCGSGCSNLIPYCIVIGITAFSMTIQIAPIYILLIRSVDETIKSSAMGIHTMMNTLIGWLPGPILYGMIFDSTCLVWTESCNRRGSCSFNNLEDLRLYFHALSLGTSVFALILALAAFIKLRNTERKFVDLQKAHSSEIELGSK